VIQHKKKLLVYHPRISQRAALQTSNPAKGIKYLLSKVGRKCINKSLETKLMDLKAINTFKTIRYYTSLKWEENA
jgi:hypothetical protein